MLDFSTLVRPKSPNTYLVCDKDDCPNAISDQAPYVFDWPLDEVLEAWQKVITIETRAKEIAHDPETHTFEYTHKTKIMRFTDIVILRFSHAVQDETTKVIVYSRSKVGYSDMGANKKRTKRWLAKLERQLRYPN